MELTAAIAIIVAAIAPFITALFTRPNMSASTKRLIAGGVAVALGAVVAIATGKVSGVPAEWIASLTWLLVTAAIVVSLAQGFYRAFQGTVKTVEITTSPAAADDSQDGTTEGTEGAPAIDAPTAEAKAAEPGTDSDGVDWEPDSAA